VNLVNILIVGGIVTAIVFAVIQYKKGGWPFTPKKTA
jgi:hypothetical protein